MVGGTEGSMGRAVVEVGIEGPEPTIERSVPGTSDRTRESWVAGAAARARPPALMAETRPRRALIWPMSRPEPTRVR